MWKSNRFQVVPTFRNPIPGWTDIWIAVPAFLSDHSRGLISVAMGQNSVICDMIPCDYVCNLAIVAAARGNCTKDMLIYNMCTSSTNPITWREASDIYLKSAIENKQWLMRPKKLILTTSPLAVHILTFIRDIAPAFINDLWLRIKGEKPRYIKLLKRSLFIRDSVKSVVKTSLILKSDRVQALTQTLDDEDKVRFRFDTKAIKWSEYIPIMQKGINKYMINKSKT